MGRSGVWSPAYSAIGAARAAYLSMVPPLVALLALGGIESVNPWTDLTQFASDNHRAAIERVGKGLVRVVPYLD
jgi:hypothetical protein